MAAAKHLARKRRAANRLAPLGFVLPCGALDDDDLAVGRDRTEHVVGDEVLAGQLFVAVVARTGVAARVRVPRARTGQQGGWWLGDPRSVVGPVAAGGLSIRSAGTVVLWGRPVPVAGTKIGISHDLLVDSSDSLL